jgi:hypothetical protein
VTKELLFVLRAQSAVKRAWLGTTRAWEERQNAEARERFAASQRKKQRLSPRRHAPWPPAAYSITSSAVEIGLFHVAS